AGLAVTLTYDGLTAAPIAAGSYAVAATIAEANYTGAATGILTIAPASAAILLGSLAHTFDGTAKSATATTVPAGLTVLLAYPGNSGAPISAGNHPVTA